MRSGQVFTGIIEERGEVRAVQRTGGGARMEVAAGTVADDAAPGASIAVDGCCVTVVDLTGGGFAAELTEQTLRVTCLSDRAPGDAVNLERPVAAGGRLGGHLVQGHVDGVGEVLAAEVRDSGTLLRLSAPPGVAEYLVPRGSVAVQGASLTVVEAGGGRFSVWLIPHTREVTTLGAVGVGDRVNLEADVVAKYVRGLLAAGAETPYAPDREGPDSPGTRGR